MAGGREIGSVITVGNAKGLAGGAGRLKLVDDAGGDADEGVGRAGDAGHQAMLTPAVPAGRFMDDDAAGPGIAQVSHPGQAEAPRQPPADEMGGVGRRGGPDG